ncbi:MAG: ISAs1 family transposase [Chloroflexia bacterium]
MQQPKSKDLKTYLKPIPDPRRRRGRIYPLDKVLAMLLLAAINGESSLRGMRVWAQKQGEWICVSLDMAHLAHPPEYGTLWRILYLLPAGALEQALQQWGEDNGQVIAIDGKTLRGSRRRAGGAALQVLVAAAQGIRLVLSQEGVKEEEVLEAALRLLEGLPLEGKVVTLDAGLDQRQVVQTVVEKGGPTWGS